MERTYQKDADDMRTIGYEERNPADGALVVRFYTVDRHKEVIGIGYTWLESRAMAMLRLKAKRFVHRLRMFA